MVRKILALVLVLALACAGLVYAEDDSHGGWIAVMLLCDTANVNDYGPNGGTPVQNTMMVVAVNPELGQVKQLMFAWDTFVEYGDYDEPKLLKFPFSDGGCAATLETLNTVFGIEVEERMAINFTNLAELIDSYGGVYLDITREERNAANQIIDSRVTYAAEAAASEYAEEATDAVSRAIASAAYSEYAIGGYGEDTHLNGLQAVVYGGMYYDSVYNSCIRQMAVIRELFARVGERIDEKYVLYTSEDEIPEGDKRIAVNINAMTAEQKADIVAIAQPVLDKSTGNVSQKTFETIVLLCVQADYMAQKYGGNLFDLVETLILPLEAQDETVEIAGESGHVIDVEANAAAAVEFLYN